MPTRARAAARSSCTSSTASSSFELAGERHVVAAGDTLHYPGDRPALWRNSGSGPARAIWLAVRGS